MKKIISGLLMSLFFAACFAAGDKHKEGTNQLALASFRMDFTGAQNVSWSRVNGLDKVGFSYNGQVLFAYYQPDGQLVAASRNLLSDQLPIKLQISLRKDFPAYWITELFEMSVEGETSYFISLQDVTKTVILKSNVFMEWELQKKVKKVY